MFLFTCFGYASLTDRRLNEIVDHGVNGMKSYTGNANSLADSILTLLYDKQLCSEVTKNAKQKVKNKTNERIRRKRIRRKITTN